MSDNDRTFNPKDREQMTPTELWEELLKHSAAAQESLSTLQEKTDGSPAALVEQPTEHRDSDIQITVTEIISHMEAFQELHQEYRRR